MDSYCLKMWFLVTCMFAFICAKCVKSELTVFHKCCPGNHSLLKIIGTNETSEFRCVSRDIIKQQYRLSTSPLIIAQDISVSYGMPEACEAYKLKEFQTAGKVELTSENNLCNDILILEVQDDGKFIDNIPKSVFLKCLNSLNETQQTSDSTKNIDRIRKCCPENEAYDMVNNLCTPLQEEGFDEEWLVKQIKDLEPNIFEVDTGINCKQAQYTIDLRVEEFSLDVYGSNLVVSSINMTKEQVLGEGEWCMDRRKVGSGLIARVCANNAAVFGAYPIRKCCPIGQHFRVRSCNTTRSDCVSNTDYTFTFNMSIYLGPLREEYVDFPDLLGVRTLILCPGGKYVTDKHNPLDNHRLTRDGHLQQIDRVQDNYCVEEFDRRHCKDDNPVMVAAALCYIRAPEVEKNFFVSFVLISVSAVCLALTLVVYVSLPELRNLHGRTLICHVGTMLLAFSCLARVQYGLVENRLCVFLGYMIYFGFVAAFGWLNVMCLDIWWTFGSVRSVQPLRKTGAERRRFLWYSLYAWSFAIVLTLTMFLFDKYPVATALDADIGKYICWFGTIQNSNADWPHYIFFVIPMGLITCTNFVLWAMTARHCARVRSEVHRLQAGSVGDRAKRRFRVDRAKYILTGKLWVVMGAGWMAEMLSTLAAEPRWLWDIIDRINELQGVFIFFILIMKPKLYYLIKKRLGLEKADAQKNGTSSARTSSTFLSRTISTDERTNLKTSLPGGVKHS